MNISYDELEKKVEEAIGIPTRLRFSVYTTISDEPWIVTDELDNIPIEGHVIFIRNRGANWIPGPNYKSKVMFSPTWLEIAKLAHVMIETVKDYGHYFLEGVWVSATENRLETLIKYNVVVEDKVKVAQFQMGS